ncbi:MULTISPECIES: alpha/beta hydrolase [Falsihalocynthiibacter]|uniref:alpha/beta hydrolase n=1 Tax=Falsihalocynthiibacter TaxID=2854182 RepID=UPI0030022D42
MNQKANTTSFKEQIDAQVLSGKVARGSDTSLPVILAIHGGTYNCDYFDIPGYSLIDRAVAQGFDIVALDRPGYRESTALPDTPDMIDANAQALNAALPALIAKLGLAGRPIFVIGHSIGGAIALTLASIRAGWSLSGIAVSGVGAETPPEDADNYANLPQQYFVELPTPMKDAVMFGPEGSYAADMPQASHMANTAVPRAELIDITGDWQNRVAGIAARIDVPVHYRQAAHEKLWLTSKERVAAFADLFTASPRVDAALIENVGHCIDFHNAGAAFQKAQLDFAAGTQTA